MENMEAMSLCEEEVFVELCRMEEPPALEEMRAAVNMRGHEWKPQTVSTFLIRDMSALIGREDIFIMFR